MSTPSKSPDAPPQPLAEGQKGVRATLVFGGVYFFVVGLRLLDMSEDAQSAVALFIMLPVNTVIVLFATWGALWSIRRLREAAIRPAGLGRRVRRMLPGVLVLSVCGPVVVIALGHIFWALGGL